MTYIVDFGPNTNSETFETLEQVEDWIDQYIENHLQYGDDFETEKKKFMKNNIKEV